MCSSYYNETCKSSVSQSRALILDYFTLTGYFITTKQYFNKNRKENAFRLLSKVKAAKHPSRRWCLLLRSIQVKIIVSPSFRHVKVVRPISFLVFPSRNVGRDTPPLTCQFSSLDLAEQTKSRQKYLHFFVCFSVFIQILLGSNTITSYHEIIHF